MFLRNLLLAVLFFFVVGRVMSRFQKASDDGLIPESPLEWFFYFERFWLAPRIFALTVFRGKEMASSRQLMLAMMAKLADADGVRQRSELAILDESLMRWFAEGKAAQLETYRLLQKIRETGKTLEEYTQQFASLFSWSLSMRANAFDLLCSIAFADGILHEDEDKVLQNCASILEIPEDEADRLRAQYGRVRYTSRSGESRSNKSQSSENRESKANQSADSRTDEEWEEFRGHTERPHGVEKDLQWAEVLGCSADASFDEVKRAYRKLVMMYHPDRLTAHGLPPEQRKSVHARFVRIQAAYESARMQLEK